MSRDEFDRLFDPAKTGGQPTAPDPEDDDLYHHPDFEDDPYKDFPLHLYEPPAPSMFERVVAGVCLACIAAAVLMLVLAVIGRAAGAPIAPSTERSQIVAPSCKVEVPGQGYGSGTLIWINYELHVLTCSHVVELAAREAYVTYTDEHGKDVRLEVPATVECTLSDGRTFTATVVYWNKDYENKGPDLALCRAEIPLSEQPNYPTAEVPHEQVQFKIGEPLWYCGWGNAVPHSLEKTIINHVDERYIRANGLGWFGHSGSGVYVERHGQYKVVGVLVLLTGRDAVRAPVLSEYRILEFIDAYKKTLKKMPKAD